MKTPRKRKRRLVPSSGRGKQARHTSPSSAGSGGGGGRGTHLPDPDLPDQGAGEVQEESASTVAPPPSFPVAADLPFAGIQFGSFPIPSSSPVTPRPDQASTGSGLLSAEIAPPPGLQSVGTLQFLPPPDGSALPSAQKSGSYSHKKSRIRNKRGSPPRVSVAPKSPSPSSSSTTSYHTVTGKSKKEHHDVAELVRKYLKSDGSYLVHEMWERKTFVLQIDYFALRRVDDQDRKAANKMCNQMSKTLLAAVEGAARVVVLELFKNEDYKQRFPSEDILETTVFENFELQILDLPSGISSLESIICKLRGHALRTLFKGHSFKQDIVEMHEALQILLNACLHKLLEGHRDGQSWSGKWTVGDWYVLNEGKVGFEGAPMMFTDHDELLTACKADLKIFATSIISLFAIAGSFPAYLYHLSNELEIELQEMTYDDYFGSEKERESRVYYSGNGWCMEYLEFHPALLSPVARFGLIEGWYICINELQYESWIEFKGTICTRLNWMDFIASKRAKEVDKIKWLMFWYQADKPNLKDSSTWKARYEDTWAQKHLFLRQLCHHSYRYTKLPGNVQTAKNEDETELNAARLEPEFLPDFVKLLLSERKMVEGFFRYWKAYRDQKMLTAQA